jgi:hypothetical protein
MKLTNVAAFMAALTPGIAFGSCLPSTVVPQIGAVQYCNGTVATISYRENGDLYVAFGSTSTPTICTLPPDNLNPSYFPIRRSIANYQGIVAGVQLAYVAGTILGLQLKPVGGVCEVFAVVNE